jgi:hypothetical protein
LYVFAKAFRRVREGTNSQESCFGIVALKGQNQLLRIPQQEVFTFVVLSLY